MTNKIIEDFVSDDSGPLKGFSTQFILGLSPDKVEMLAREDETTMRRREELRGQMEELQRAHKIAEAARERTVELERI